MRMTDNSVGLSKFFKRIKNSGYYLWLMFRFAGLKAGFSVIFRQIYSNNTQFGLLKYLDDIVYVPNEGKINYKLHRASSQDMEDAFKKIRGESPESAGLLLERKWLYDCGFTNWYIARTEDSNDPCFIQGVLIPEDYERVNNIFKNWFPKLNKDEILLEGAYAFEEYRGSKLCHKIAVDIWDIHKKLGYKKMKTYVKKDNHASLRAAAKTGFQKFEEVPIYKVLFLKKTKFGRNSS